MDRIPVALFRVFFHDEQGSWLRWSTERIWALPTPVTLAVAGSLAVEVPVRLHERLLFPRILLEA